MRIRWVGLLVTAVITIVSVVSLATQGLNLGLDFTGGVLIEASQDAPFDVETVRAEVAAAGMRDASVNTADNGRTVMIRLPAPPAGESVETVARTVRKVLGETAEIRRTDAVGPKVSGELFRDGIIASILSVIMIAIYVWFRFESKFGWAALITTFHDVLAILGLFSVTRMVFDLTTVAAVLTIAGYSINDTVVVFDRMRETLKKYKQMPVSECIDRAITATLSRTIMTACTTLLAALSMVFLGGPVLFGFAIAITFGILLGTYSSIFVAAPLLIYLPGRMPGARASSRTDAVLAP